MKMREFRDDNLFTYMKLENAGKNLKSNNIPTVSCEVGKCCVSHGVGGLSRLDGAKARLLFHSALDVIAFSLQGTMHKL